MPMRTKYETSAETNGKFVSLSNLVPQLGMTRFRVETQASGENGVDKTTLASNSPMYGSVHAAREVVSSCTRTRTLDRERGKEGNGGYPVV